MNLYTYPSAVVLKTVLSVGDRGKKQVAQLSQRGCAASGSVLAKSGKRHSADNIGLSSTTIYRIQ